MTLFNYTGRDSAGNLQTQQRDADSEETLYEILLSENITPINITKVTSEKKVTSNNFTFSFGSKKVNIGELTMFSRQMYTLIKAGVSITLAFQQLSENTRNPRLKIVLQSIAVKLREGMSLADAMSDFPDVFSPLIVGMVRVGQNTGYLEQSFLHLNEYLELETNTIKKLKKVLRYPTFVVIAIVGAIAILITYVIPTFVDVYHKANIELPQLTLVLIAVSNFFRHHWLISIILIGSVYWGFRTYFRTPAGKYLFDQYTLKVPIFGPLIKKIILLRFTQQFSISFSAGIPLTDGLALVSQSIENSFVNKKIKNMKEAIEQGNSLTQAANSIDFFTPLELQMFAIGEQTGDLGNVFNYICDFYQREVDYDLQKLGDSIQPLLIVFLGFLVLFLALAIYLPIWNMVSFVKH